MILSPDNIISLYRHFCFPPLSLFSWSSAFMSVLWLPIMTACLLITFLFILGLVAQSTTAFSSIRNGVGGSHRFNIGKKLKLESTTTLNDSIPTQLSRVANIQLKSTTLNDIPTKSTQSLQQPIERVAIVGAGKSRLYCFVV